MYFLRGSLPWQGLNARSKREKYEMICRTKLDTAPEMLCRHYPSEFATYLNYCRSLGFEDRPDYAYLRRTLRDLFARSGFRYDFTFDWSQGGNSKHRQPRTVAAEAPQCRAAAEATPPTATPPTAATLENKQVDTERTDRGSGSTQDRKSVV